MNSLNKADDILKAKEVTQKRERITYLKIFTFVVAVAIFATTLTKTVSARILGNIGGGISGAFSSYASSTGPTMFDFLIFAVIFFALCLTGFNAVFKDGKKTNIVLSLAVGFALTIGLVYGGGFTLKKILPFSAVILAILMFVGIYAALKKIVFTKDTVPHKIIAFVIALIIAILLVVLASAMICSSNRCDSNPFLNKVFGAGSAIGGFFSGLGDGTSTSSIDNNLPATLCGNGKVDKGERCDTALDNSCPRGQACNYGCKQCVPEDELSAIGTAAGDAKNAVVELAEDDTFGIDNWLLAIILLALISLGILSAAKRKTIKGWVGGFRKNHKAKNAIARLKNILGIVDHTEGVMKEKLIDLKTDVKEEQGTFKVTKEIVDDITREIKDSIGLNIAAMKSGTNRDLHGKLDKLKTLNNHEKELANTIVSQITLSLGDIQKEIDLHPEISETLREIDNIEEHFNSGDNLLKHLGNYQAREEGMIQAVQADLSSEQKNMENLMRKCDAMAYLANAEKQDVERVARGGDIKYSETVKALKDLHLNTLKLKNMFADKVTLLHYIFSKFDELKGDINKIHKSEVDNLRALLEDTKTAISALNTNRDSPPPDERRADQAIYLASLVADNAKLLEHSEMTAEDKAELKKIEAEAKKLIIDCIANLHTFLSRIEDDMIDALNKVKSGIPFTKVRGLVRAQKFALHLSHIDFVNSDHGKEHLSKVKKYQDTMKKIITIAARIQKNFKILDEVRTTKEFKSEQSKALSKSAAELTDAIEIASTINFPGNLVDLLKERLLWTRIVHWLLIAKLYKQEGKEDKFNETIEKIKTLHKPGSLENNLPNDLKNIYSLVKSKGDRTTTPVGSVVRTHPSKIVELSAELFLTTPLGEIANSIQFFFDTDKSKINSLEEDVKKFILGELERVRSNPQTHEQTRIQINTILIQRSKECELSRKHNLLSEDAYNTITNMIVRMLQLDELKDRDYSQDNE